MPNTKPNPGFLIAALTALSRVLRSPSARWAAMRRRLSSLPALARAAVYSALIAVVLAAALLIGLHAAGHFGGTVRSSDSERGPVTVTSVVADIRAHRVTGAIIDDATSQLRLTYAPQAAGAGLGSPAAASTVVVQVPADYLGDLERSLISAGVPVTVGEARSGSGVNLELLAMLLALAAAAGLLAYRWHRRSVRRAAERAATSAAVAVPAARFRDVAGCDEAIEDLRELVLFLREPERFTRTGAKPPKGALLCGPPGTGKTLLARAVAGESGVPMLVAAGSDFAEKFVGVGAQRVRDLFAEARTYDRAIVFIDELDAVARARSQGGEIGSGEQEQTLIALLAEMDGFASSNVIVLAATNRPDVLDPAITRPGRLDRKVEVPNPDRRGRERILQVHLRDKPVATDLDLLGLARRTPGFSGAQLEALVNEACIDAVRRDLAEVDQLCFDAAVATVAMGRARTSALVTDHDRRITAWHEAGHTIAAYLQPDADDPVQVSIVPRGPAGGVTWLAGSDNAFLTRRAALAQLVTALAGRAAEEALLEGEYTQGASGDLLAATNLAFQMATQYGMTTLGYRVHSPQSAAGSQSVGEVVEELLSEAYLSAVALIEDHRGFLSAVATTLLDQETLTLAEVEALALGSSTLRHAELAVSVPARGRVHPGLPPVGGLGPDLEKARYPARDAGGRAEAGGDLAANRQRSAGRQTPTRRPGPAYGAAAMLRRARKRPIADAATGSPTGLG